MSKLRSPRFLLFTLLAVLAGAGAWNFQRNLEAERAEPRPFRGYADAEVATLLDAYRDELETHRRRWEAATGRKVDVQDAGVFEQKLQEFERVQRISRRARDLATQLARTMVTIDRLELEQRKRVEEHQVVRHFLTRLLTVRA